jgi:hypothetical protein
MLTLISRSEAFISPYLQKELTNSRVAVAFCCIEAFVEFIAVTVIGAEKCPA